MRGSSGTRLRSDRVQQGGTGQQSRQSGFGEERFIEIRAAGGHEQEETNDCSRCALRRPDCCPVEIPSTWRDVNCARLCCGRTSVISPDQAARRDPVSPVPEETSAHARLSRKPLAHEQCPPDPE